MAAAFVFFTVSSTIALRPPSKTAVSLGYVLQVGMKAAGLRATSDWFIASYRSVESRLTARQLIRFREERRYHTADVV